MNRNKKLITTQETLLLLAVCGAIAFFSMSVLMEKSLRLDEAQSVWQTSHTLLGTLTIIMKDIHLPLYFVGLRLWEMVFGTSVNVLRSFSLLFLLLSIPAIYILAKETYNKHIAFIVVAMVALSPFLEWYGAEARMYTLLFFLTTLNHLFFIRIWREQAARPLTWLMYGTTAVLGALTHYFFLFILLVQVFYYFTHKKLFPRDALGKFISVALIIMTALGSWWYIRAHVGTSNADPQLARPTSVDLFNIFSSDFIGLQTSALNTFFLALWPFLILLCFTLLARKRAAPAETSYFFFASIVPIVLAFFASIFVRPLFVARYLVVTVPSLYILAAYFINAYKLRARTALAALVLVVMSFSLGVEAFSSDIPVDENYRAAADYVTTHAHANDIFVVSAPFTTYPIEYYYRGDARLTTFPVWSRYEDALMIPPFSEEDLAEQTALWSHTYSNLYILMSYDQGYEETERLYLDHHYERVSVTTFSPNLTLYVYKLRYL